jgi:hypothetical protein
MDENFRARKKHTNIAFSVGIAIANLLEMQHSPLY